VFVVVSVAVAILFIIFFMILFKRSNRNSDSLNQDEVNYSDNDYLKDQWKINLQIFISMRLLVMF
jgi:hypothetical protein